MKNSNPTLPPNPSGSSGSRGNYNEFPWRTVDRAKGRDRSMIFELPKPVVIPQEAIEKLRQDDIDSEWNFEAEWGPFQRRPFGFRGSSRYTERDAMVEAIQRLQQDLQGAREQNAILLETLREYRKNDEVAEFAFDTGAPVVFERKPGGGFRIVIDPRWAQVESKTRPVRKFRLETK